MPRLPCVAALAAALTIPAPALSAQIRVSAGFGGGVMLPMGDLASTGSTGSASHAYVMFRGHDARYAFGLEGVYHHTTLDGVFVYGTPTVPGRSVDGLAWSAYGGMIRYEYDILRGLYAVGGAGLLYRRVVPPDDAPTTAPITSHDFTADAGLGFEGPEGLRVEVRLVNIFTVNDSDRFVPITVGFRF